MSKIKFKHIRIGKFYFSNAYSIYTGKTCIGEINFKKQNNIFIIGFILIYPEYRNKYYGYEVIEYILSHYKIKCIIGESLESSRGFWNKCIHRYNGQRKNISISTNCSSSFIIPKCKIDDQYFEELLYISSDLQNM